MVVRSRVQDSVVVIAITGTVQVGDHVAARSTVHCDRVKFVPHRARFTQVNVINCATCMGLILAAPSSMDCSLCGIIRDRWHQATSSVSAYGLMVHDAVGLI